MRNETIKLSEVKTMEQLNVVSDRWYNRADYLKSIWQDPEQSARNRYKAFLVWSPYLAILTALSSIYIENSQQQTSSLKSGRIVGESHQNEVVLNKSSKFKVF